MYRPAPLQPLLNLPVRGYRQPVRPVLNLNHSLSRGLVGCWLLNEGSGTFARDISPFANHGALENFSAGGVWANSHHGGQGLQFDGVNRDVTISSNLSLNVAAGDFTAAVWIYITSFSSYAAVFDKLGSIAANRELALFIVDGANGYYGVGCTAGGALTFSPQMTTGAWQFVVWVRSGTANTLYRNGVSCATFTDGNTAVRTNPLCIAGNTSGGGTWFNGREECFRLYNRALSLPEIFLLFSEPYAGIVETGPRAAMVGSAAAATAGFPYYQSFIGRVSGIGGSV